MPGCLLLLDDEASFCSGAACTGIKPAKRGININVLINMLDQLQRFELRRKVKVG